MRKQTLLICIDGMAGHYLDNPDVNIPNLRALIRTGSLVSRLKTTFPSVTWTANTSAVTGCHPSKHGVIGNSIYNYEKQEISHYWGDKIDSKENLVHVETIYDQLAKRNEKTASICWPVTREARNIAYNIPEHYDQKLFEKYSTPSFWNELRPVLPINKYGKWSADFSLNHMQDWLTKEIVRYVIEYKDTQLLMAHFLLIDSMLHVHGNHSPEVFCAMEYVDRLIGELLTCLEEQGRLEETDIIPYSDHGHVDVHTNVYPNRLLVQEGLDKHYKAVSNDGCFYLYRLTENKQDDGQVKHLFNTLPFIKRVLSKDTFNETGLLSIDTSPHFIIELDDGYVSKDDEEVSETTAPSTYKATHGYSPDHTMLKGFMIGSGPSFKPGSLVEEAEIIDIAPTLARIHDVQLPDADGRALDELLHPRNVLIGGE
ncbi:ectonucleotide pyrophosphatase/phosphodiesterase [Pseudalkalibacillus sp. SCS-8]|uniref:alkaline phosphatase family protein n=1 Tax=Pseudalkalibacillus nanhaiensis TaxID=3115291 RepID=UPI0032DBD9EA